MASSDTANPIDHRVKELVSLFGGTVILPANEELFLEGQQLSEDEVTLLRNWDQMVHTLYTSKFDCVLSPGHQNSVFDGLNQAVTQKYLTDDLTYDYSLPLSASAEFGAVMPGAGYNQEGYLSFNYEDLRHIILEEEWPIDNPIDGPRTRRRQSLFQAGARRAVRRDSANYNQPYPRTLGTAGATLVTPALQRLAQSTNQRLAQSTNQRLAQSTNQRLAQSTNLPDPTALNQPSDIVIDGLPISGALMPALSGAVKFANTAFLPAGKRLGRSKGVAGVFNLAKAEQALQIATLASPNDGTEEFNSPSDYMQLTYDAAEQTWLVVSGDSLKTTDGSNPNSKAISRPNGLTSSKAALQQFSTMGAPKPVASPWRHTNKSTGNELTAAMSTLIPGASSARNTSYSPLSTYGHSTSTGAEMFAAKALNNAKANASINSLLAPIDSPISVAGETHVGYGGFALPMDDPVVYLNLSSESSAANLKRPLVRALHQTNQMSPLVKASVGAVTMPLSSAANLESHTADIQRLINASMSSVPRASQGPATKLVGLSKRSKNWVISDLNQQLTGVPSNDIGTEKQTQGIFYNYSYDAAPILLNVDSAQYASPLAGSHVEVHGGRIKRSISATPQTGTTQTPQIGTIRSRSIASPLSATEAGFPALSLSRGRQAISAHLSSTGKMTDPAAHDSVLAGILATSGEAEFAMLPPVIQRMLNRQSDGLAKMTAGGSDSGGLLERLADSLESVTPGVRTRVMHQLAQLGVDTPELLSLLGSSAPQTTKNENGILRQGAPELATGPNIETNVNTQLKRVARQLTGGGSAATQFTGIGTDAYWGDFGPLQMKHKDAADLLGAILGTKASRTEQRDSNAAWAAEQGDLLSLSSDSGPTITRLGEARTMGARFTDLSAPGATERTIQTPDFVSQSSRFEGLFGDSSAYGDFAVSSRLGGFGGAGTSYDRANYGSDFEFTGLEKTDALQSMAQRVHTASTPWLKGKADSETQVSDTHGVRGYQAGGITALIDTLGSLRGTQNIASFLGSGFDFTYTVLDRVNGSLAGYDLGVLKALQRSAASAAGDPQFAGMDGQEIRPGLDSWPEEALELLGPYRQQLQGQSSAHANLDTEQQVTRLERRVDAAQQAYERLQTQRDASHSPRSFDSVDWSLVSTGAAHDTRAFMDLGSLGQTMVSETSLPSAEMTHVAPAVKVVAQQAQLSTKKEASHSGSRPTATSSDQKSAAKKEAINYDEVAAQIARRLERRMRYDQHRRGRF